MKLVEFAAQYPFGLDPFQVRAIEAIDDGHSVLVAAPTGSGKTVVAEYAVAKALAEGHKAFYTTPLKALSNQKYGDLLRRHGAENVGLLTGDNSINGGAPIVVMTTEVLRNMLYSRSPALDGLRYVVLDEVHYLQNQYRGPVWEEVIIHSPHHIGLVCLSATVSNAEEFADWIRTVRGETVPVIEERRPVELTHLYMASDRDTGELHMLETFVDAEELRQNNSRLVGTSISASGPPARASSSDAASKPNPAAARLDSRMTRAPQGPGRRRSALSTPRRAEVVARLGDESMLPAIFFIFSRAACDDAVRQCLSWGLNLTDDRERAAIRAIAEASVEPLSDDDLSVLEYTGWLQALESGLAAHHAGMVPPFKEAVEACFSAGLVKAVFATETLALGINMPARTVVIEKLSKFTGERHEFLTPGEYTQLTGRAGRRGIDDAGYAIVLWSPFVPFDQVAGLASTRTYALTSSFRPTYNMAANLVRLYPPDDARHLLNLSFAQYRADRDVVRLEAQLERSTRARDAAREEATCELGDVAEYVELTRREEVESAKVRGSGHDRRREGGSRVEVVEALSRVRPGDVLVLSGGKTAGRVAVVSTARRRGGEVRLGGLTVDRRYLTLSERDFQIPPRAAGRIELPTPFAPRNAAFQRQVAKNLAGLRLTPPAGGSAEASGSHGERGRRGGGRASGAAAHPVAGCPQIGRHVRAHERAYRLDRDVTRLERRIRGRTESLARQFDRVLRLMELRGYVDGWTLTPQGELLARVYHECDLLLSEALISGLFDGLDAAGVAALASAFTFEARGGPRGGPEPARPWFPSGSVKERWQELERMAADLTSMEEDAGLPVTRMPDPGFVGAAYGWVTGADLSDVMDDETMSPGDFVRNIKQLIDLVRQLATIAPDPAVAEAASAAADRLFRGVVAASSAVG